MFSSFGIAFAFSALREAASILSIEGFNFSPE
jgi:hypothetical protein